MVKIEATKGLFNTRKPSWLQNVSSVFLHIEQVSGLFWLNNGSSLAQNCTDLRGHLPPMPQGTSGPQTLDLGWACVNAKDGRLVKL